MCKQKQENKKKKVVLLTYEVGFEICGMVGDPHYYSQHQETSQEEVREETCREKGVKKQTRC